MARTSTTMTIGQTRPLPQIMPVISCIMAVVASVSWNGPPFGTPAGTGITRIDQRAGQAAPHLNEAVVVEVVSQSCLAGSAIVDLGHPSLRSSLTDWRWRW